MKKVTVSAPGKLMLLGEHAVVYGHPCIVTAVGQRMFLTAEKDTNPNFTFESKDIGIRGHKKPMKMLGIGEVEKGARFVELAVKNFTDEHNIKGGVKITTKSEFSSTLGFGSSSAATACTVRALCELFGIKLSNKELFDIAYKTVLDVQGKGSGFDIAAAIYGGTIYFVTGGKVIKPLQISRLPLVVGYSGVKADTVTLINKVADLSNRYPEVVKNIYKNIDDLVELAKKPLLNEDWETLGELMSFNQGYLEALGVSTDKLSSMIYAARNAGAYGAKLSGAGGGDCVIAIVEKNTKQAVQNAIEKAGGEVVHADTNVEGVRIEKLV